MLAHDYKTYRIYQTEILVGIFFQQLLGRQFYCFIGVQMQKALALAQAA